MVDTMAGLALEALTWTDVYRLLAETQPSLGLRNVPNARVQTELRILEWLTSAAETETVSHLQEALAQLGIVWGSLKDLWSLTEHPMMSISVGQRAVDM